MITSTSNSQIKNIIKLQKSSKARREQQLFVVEGIRMFKEIPKDLFRKAYSTENFFDKNRELFDSLEYELVEEKILKEASDTLAPQGIIGVVKQPVYTFDEVCSNGDNKQSPCLMVLENLRDPGNVGTIVRTSEGAGMTGIILNRESVDIFNPKVIRSTMGSIFRVPFVYMDDLNSVLKVLHDMGITTYAGHLDGQDFYEEDFTKGTAFLIGNEGNGLSESISDLANTKIKIPMCGQVESLNAAIAATILMYETLKQRRI